MAEFTNVSTRKQSRPRQTVCGDCGTPVDNNALLCNECIEDTLRSLPMPGRRSDESDSDNILHLG
jgi:hypothetical protein